MRRLSRDEYVLSCGHTILDPPIAKGRAPLVPCMACALGLPTDLEVVLAAIREASPEDLRAITAAVQARAA